MNYKTCRKIIIYLNKVKIAKQTLEKFIDNNYCLTSERMVKDRLELLKQFQLELISFLVDCEDELPFNPSERCRAVVFWFSSQKIMETSDIKTFEHKIHMADGMMRSECIHILADNSIPDKLKQLLEDHLKRIALLKEKEEVTKTA